MEFLTRILFVAAMLCVGWLSYTMDKQAQEHRQAMLAVEKERAANLSKLHTLEKQHEQKIAEIEHVAQTKLATVQHSAATARRAAAGLRQQLTSFAKRGAATDSAAACECQAEQGRIDLLSQLLGELDGMAGEYAAAADESRQRGLACELSYEAVR